MLLAHREQFTAHRSLFWKILYSLITCALLVLLCVISHPCFLVLLSSIGGRTSFLCSKLYPCTAQFIFISFYTREAFSCFLPLKDLNPSLFYLNLPTFPNIFSLWLYLKSYIAVLIYFDGAEIKDTTTTTSP